MFKSLFPTLFVSMALVAVLVGGACDKKVGKKIPEVVVASNICDSATYTLKVKKLIETNCAIPNCHTSGFGNGDFTSYGGLKSKVDNGSVKDRIKNQDRPMPPLDKGGLLSNDKIKLIECWLDKGATEK